MAIRHSKPNVEKSLRWAFHHGATHFRRAKTDDTRSRSEAEEEREHIVDAGDGGLVAPELAGAPASDLSRQPPPHDYSRRTPKLDALVSVDDMRDEDGAGGPIWTAVLGGNTSDAMRRFALLIGAFVFISAVLFWLLA